MNSKDVESNGRGPVESAIQMFTCRMSSF